MIHYYHHYYYLIPPRLLHPLFVINAIAFTTIEVFVIEDPNWYLGRLLVEAIIEYYYYFINFQIYCCHCHHYFIIKSLQINCYYYHHDYFAIGYQIYYFRRGLEKGYLLRMGFIFRCFQICYYCYFELRMDLVILRYCCY